jgi:hypothetical protein
MRRLSQLLLVLLFTACLTGLSVLPPTHASNPWDVSPPDYSFGKQATFQARFESGKALEKATIFIQIEGESKSFTATVTPPGNMVVQVDLSRLPVRAFSKNPYWFEATLTDGSTLDSDKYTFDYVDNRFDWHVQETPPFSVHWYEGDTGFAQSIIDIANAGLERIQSLVTLPELQPIDIYAYASAGDMQVALDLSEQKWVAGHADPDLGVMVVWLPIGPEQRLLMEQRIPHELMHIMLYQKTLRGYTNLPTWLNEGLASVAELYPNPDYLILLENASQKKSFLTMSSLCRAFPRDVSGTQLAYAQATSFTRYLQQQYGTSSLEKLVSAYADGLSCERGIQSVFGVTLTKLERDWRSATFGENAVANAFSNLLPWLVLMGLALAAPIGLVLRGWRKRPATQSAK